VGASLPLRTHQERPISRAAVPGKEGGKGEGNAAIVEKIERRRRNPSQRQQKYKNIGGKLVQRIKGKGRHGGNHILFEGRPTNREFQDNIGQGGTRIARS